MAIICVILLFVVQTQKNTESRGTDMKNLKKLVILAICGILIMGESCETEAYNGYNAASYARKYATNYNKNYDNYSSDCTNFVSQCIEAGGKSHSVPASGVKKKKGGNITATGSHWYYRGNASTYAASTSWLRCSGSSNTFLSYWKNHSKYSTYNNLSAARKNCKVGDVIQICDKNYKIHHSVICVTKTNNDIYCASHTSDYMYKSLESITDSANKKYGPIKYLIYHFA